MAEQDISSTLPESLAQALAEWAGGLAKSAAAPLREQLAVATAEREATIERLTIELRNARDIASNALVGKAKDQLAIEGKDRQLADLRRQLEQQVAASAAQSDACLAAEMELVGATTARDNLAAELAEVRAQLDAFRAGRVAA
ncbi:hypothetical protein [Pelomonas sp. KK5]|uniref:hypothetical protein n=1 Tax=Pelomonas sp. KK5 TaxID=1855730 RepID=UPI00097C00E4|nr:hypothetical protein [Pelomonas sp. KK5]